jgi:tRNA G46 methylase TrmB
MKNAWEEIYRKGKLLKLEPHPEMSDIATFFKKRTINRILDVGSGGGRHIVYLASKGFDVYGLDISPAGLAYTLNVLSEKNLSAHLTLHDMTALP